MVNSRHSHKIHDKFELAYYSYQGSLAKDYKINEISVFIQGFFYLLLTLTFLRERFNIFKI